MVLPGVCAKRATSDQCVGSYGVNQERNLDEFYLLNDPRKDNQEDEEDDVGEWTNENNERFLRAVQQRRLVQQVHGVGQEIKTGNRRRPWKDL